jgi:hypothetical protein
MSSWHCFVEERAEQMRMLRRGAAALVLIAPRRAFLAWGQHALATQRALAKLLRVFEPTRRLLGRAFNTLCDTADGMRSVRRAAAAMMHRQRRRALNAWRDGCASRERCLGLMHQGVAALVFHERARAMNTWVEATESARARLRRLSVACGECRSAAFRSAWFTWIESHERRSRAFGALSSLRHRNARLAFNRLRSLKATKTFLSRTTERRC